MEAVLYATKCGLMLHGVKSELLVERSFEDWFQASAFRFSRMTRWKYMQLAERMCVEASCKSSLLVEVRHDDAAQPTFACDESQLKVTVEKISEGRSLLELYIAWEIVKPSKKSGKENADTKATDNRNVSPQRTYKTWTAFVDIIPTIFPQLASQEQTHIVNGLESLLSRLKQLQVKHTTADQNDT